MIRKVAIGVAVVVILVIIGWQLVAAPATSEFCRFPEKPRAGFIADHLQLSFEGHLYRGLMSEAKRSLFGRAQEDDGCGLIAEVFVEPPFEPGVFAIEGEAELGKYGPWTFKPGPGNHPKVKLARVSAQADFGAATFKLRVSGTLTIDKASASELTGRLKLQSEGTGGARVSYRFDATPQ